MVVLEPLKLTIENFDEFKNISAEVRDFPSDPNSSVHNVSFDRVIYIEREDYIPKAPKGFRRLSDDQRVGLKYLGLVLSVVGKEEVSSSIDYFHDSYRVV